jgi:purine nucleoside permease/dienelactone hydrolase
MLLLPVILAFQTLPFYEEKVIDSMAIRERYWRQLQAYAQSLPVATAPTGDTLASKIGFPAPGLTAGTPRLERAGEDSIGTYFRCWIPLGAGLESYGLYIVPKGAPGPTPLVIAKHGGGGSPELALYEGGGNYHDMIRGPVQRGYVVYAPLTITYPYRDRDHNTPIPQEVRAQLDKDFRARGTSLMAVEVTIIQRSLDAVAKFPDVDPSRIGMIGLSYGGFYTLYTAALDPRIRVAVASCSFREQNQVPQPEEGRPVDMAPAEFVRLIGPRALQVQSGVNDTGFPIDSVRRAAASVKETPGFEFREFDGVHEFRGDLAWEFLEKHLKPIPVKVAVVAMFEPGADTGDTPGEFQYWVEREQLDRIIPLPHGYHDLRMNSEGVLGMVTGVGTAKAAAAIMAVGLDPRFDFSQTYWLVAGIAGIDPADGSLGSAAWAEYVVDGDLGHEIDAREIPKDWKTGFIPLRRSTPYEQPRRENDGEVFHLNPGLVEWAFLLTRDVKLPDTDAIRKRREQFSQRAARRPPFVMKGDTLSSMTFWHGALLDQWANDWVKYHTGGKGNYVTTAMEDTGTLQSLTLLAKTGRVDLNRVLVLRTASNFDQQRTGISAAESLAETKVTSYSAYLPSLDSACRVGSVVVHELTGHWNQYASKIPVR